MTDIQTLALITLSCNAILAIMVLQLIKQVKMNIIQFPTCPAMKEVYVMPNGVTLYEKNGNVGTYLELRYA